MNPYLKKLLKEVVQHKKILACVILAGLAQSSAVGGYAWLMKQISDGLQFNQMEKVYSSFYIILILSLIACVSRYFNLYLMDCISEMVAVGLRRKLQKKFMHLSLTFHNNYSSGSGGLISRILTDIVLIKDGLRLVADFFREPILLVVLLTSLFWFNWKLTISIILILPLLIRFLRQIARSLRKYGEQGQKQLEQVTSTIKESLDGVRVIQSFNLEKFMENRFFQESEIFLQARKKFYSRLEISGPITEYVATLAIMGIFYYLIQQTSSGKSTYGDLIAYVTVLLQLNPPIKKIQESYVKLQETTVAATRIFSILEEDSEVEQINHPAAFPEKWQSITYKNVGFKYGKERVLKNINLTIKRGEVIAFVGESGSGKSTIVNLLERFYDASEGQILIDEIPIQNFSLHDLRKHIALVSQDVFLFSDSILNNIMSGQDEKAPERAIEAAKSANAFDFINKMPEKFSSRVGERGSLLSGGERQRVSMARAMYKNAPILILDEATSALDSASEIEVQKGLDKLMTGKTTLVVAHRLSTIQNADKIVVIKKGEICEIGTHQELVQKQGEYFRFFTLQKV